MLKRGDAEEIKPIRSEAHGKENKVLKPWLRSYQHVDENITAVPNKLCPYQLVHEGGQFRMEHPYVSQNSYMAVAISLRFMGGRHSNRHYLSLCDICSIYLDDLECHFCYCWCRVSTNRCRLRRLTIKILWRRKSRTWPK